MSHSDADGMHPRDADAAGVDVAFAVEDVEVVRRGRTILGPISLRVARGEHWVVLGPNGGGKTTLASLATMATWSTRGTVHVLGHQLGRVDTRTLKRRVGWVSHRLGELVRDGAGVTPVGLVAAAHRGAVMPFDDRDRAPAVRARARELLARLGVEEVADAMWRNCSQGERARVLLARAMVTDPDLLVLDEPAVGLDLPGREQLLVALHDLSSSLVASLHVTHHLEQIPAMTTHALLLREGRAVASGRIGDVLTAIHLSQTFDLPLRVDHHLGRWSAQLG